jgi:nitrile hydratase accessory protein
MRPDRAREVDSVSDAPPQDPDRTFAEPWQARAFAIAVLASRQGCFTWSEWTHALARELQRASAPNPRAGEGSYFDCWLAALQSLLVNKQTVAPDEIQARKEAWQAAYQRTPHGMPVSLPDP